MSDHKNFNLLSDDSQSESEIRRLLEEAGKRPEPPAEDLARITAVARSAWNDSVRKKQSQRFQTPTRRVFALAASLALASLAGWWWVRTDAAPVAGATVATVEFVDGAAVSGDQPVHVGLELRENVEVDSGSGRLTLRMVDGQSLRLDENTMVRLHSRSGLELLRGGVYIDSPPSVDVDRHLDVVTSLGTVVEIGTQFEVRLGDDGSALDVRVREGAVSVRNEGRAVTARLGETLTVREDGSVSRGVVEPHADSWAWVIAAAPTPEIDGQPLVTFLEWVSRETGWEINYATHEIETSAASILLHGSVDGLRPEEAVEVFLRGSGLDHRLDDGVLTVSRP